MKAIAAFGGSMLSCHHSEMPNTATHPHIAKANGDHCDLAIDTAATGWSVVRGTRQQSTASVAEESCTFERHLTVELSGAHADV
jgi:hypothetical protein